ncbi:hypothetical protein GCM10009802_03740 [Streptomyces synnematoformans]|uniref:Uncharacterized protein n=1 Tax=Streptomyces synnematoformans TaxID=415721 RepID=A0ABN2XCB9_9ACTN
MPYVDHVAGSVEDATFPAAVSGTFRAVYLTHCRRRVIATGTGSTARARRRHAAVRQRPEQKRACALAVSGMSPRQCSQRLVFMPLRLPEDV